MFTLNHLWFPDLLLLVTGVCAGFFRLIISMGNKFSTDLLVMVGPIWMIPTPWNFNSGPGMKQITLKTCVRVVPQISIMRTARFGQFLPILAKKCSSLCDGKCSPWWKNVSCDGKVLQLAGMFQHCQGHIGTKKTNREAVNMIMFPSHLPSDANARKLTINIGGREIAKGPHKG